MTPPDFDASAYLGSSWGIIVEGKVKNIKLRFDTEIARIMEEMVWHPSKVFEPKNDGSLIMTLMVTNTVEVYSWILSCGEKVEVLEPVELRKEIIEFCRIHVGRISPRLVICDNLAVTRICYT